MTLSKRPKEAARVPSIIIPAHNEEAVIERTLRAVLADAVEDLEVVVIVNASTDATADIARSVDPGINVLETQTPGKCNALNLGEATLASFPRVFLDADIQLLPGSLSKLLNASGPDRPIVSPSPSFRSLRSDPRDATFLSRAAIQPILRPAGPRTAAVASYSPKMLGRDGRPSLRSSLTTASSKGNSNRMNAPPSPAPKRSSNLHATSGR